MRYGHGIRFNSFADVWIRELHKKSLAYNFYSNSLLELYLLFQVTFPLLNIIMFSVWAAIFLLTFLKIFFICTIFKVFIEFVTIELLFYVLVSWLWGMWCFNIPTREWTWTPCIGRWSLNHWTTREVPGHDFLLAFYTAPFIFFTRNEFLCHSFHVSFTVTHPRKF